MSRATGHVIKDDTRVGYCIYNGTIDHYWANIYSHSDIAWSEWTRYYNKHEPITRQCTCGKPPEKVWLWNEYGQQSEKDGWDGTACLACMVIIDGLMSPEEEEQYRIEKNLFNGRDSK